MKSLVYGCSAAALLMGVALQAHAESVVREAPLHAVPADDEDAGGSAPLAAETAAPAQAQAPAKVEPAPVKALVQPKAPPAEPALTPEENAFFAVLGQRVTDAASAYESYVRRAGAIDPAFTGASSVQRLVKAGAAYHPLQLQEGMVAYTALIALRNPEFVEGVRAIQNPSFADDLAAHPERVMEVRGAAEAAGDAAGVLKAQGETLIAAGKAITKAAYDIQAQPWSKTPVADPKGVLEGAKTSAGQRRAATTPSKEKLLASLVTAPQSAGGAAAPAPDVERGLALAALAILGRTGDQAEARYEALLRDASSEECLKMAKLNLNQCLAVAGPHYEDVYCAGRHAVSDTGKCISAAAGDAPVDAVPAPRLEVAAIGPEQAAVYGQAPTAGAEEEEDDDARPAPAAPTAIAAAPAVPPPVIASAPALTQAAPAPAPAAEPAPAPRQYAEVQPAPQYQPPQYPQPQYQQGQYPQPQYPQGQYQPQPAPYPQAQYAPPQYQPPQRAEPMPDPRLPRSQAYGYAQPQPQPYSYAQNDYAPPQQAPYGRQGYAQPSYPQPAYPPSGYQQAYPAQPYAPAYPQQPGYQNGYGAQPQPYAPQSYGYRDDYYGR